MGTLIEILVLAFGAAMIIFKLISVLGQRTGFDPSEGRRETFRDPLNPSEKQETTFSSSEEELIGPGLRKIYAQMLSVDSRFSLSRFLAGATRAFEMIVLAYAKEDLKSLKSLLSSEVYKDFEVAVKERQQKRESLETTIAKIESSQITDMRLQETEAMMTVRFISEQTHVIRNEAGEIIEGTAKQSEQIIDIWTFSRDLRSKDFQWTLIKVEQ
ncbi:MAG: Tim44 domain-containing protein [Candidatus Paracaedimonas acanthamoebae]|uniref:Tim44 domain-containing protein n=1 Tax=Candidatus Paracaedimonas acanthamoebae TaxID=244581 RepID=A0A8J7PIX1_9PROT|nr:Tim44 domain-containing protein [Candidatus Paracaedimonas acanthamoebae]